MQGGRPKEYTDEDIEELGKALIQIANKDHVYHVTEFSELKEKSPTWVYELARQYPKFSEYLTRARTILGRKLLKLSIEENPSQYIQKTFIKRYLSNEFEDMNQWVKEDVEMEAKIKAEAVKAANLVEIDPRFAGFLKHYENHEKSS